MFSTNAEINNKDVPKHMAERKDHRMASRRGERLRRQRRAVASGTCFTEMQRVLPQCKEPITCKFIKNSEARFCNCRRPDGWLTPTANHLLQCHINLVKKLQKFLPITAVVLEMNTFAFMAMDNPSIQRWQYQRGQLYGLGSVEDAVNLSQDGHCLFCAGQIDHHHHVVPRSKGCSETLPNRAGLCSEHHVLVHTDDIWTAKLTALKAGLNKKYGALSVLNQIIPSMAVELADIFSGRCSVTTGRDTAAFRLANGIAKDHRLDAYCVACSTIADAVVSLPDESFTLHRFRGHDKAVVSRQEERKYYLNKQLVARNCHKRME